MKDKHDFEGRIEKKEAIISGLRGNKKVSKAIIDLKIHELNIDRTALRIADRLQSGEISEGVVKSGIKAMVEKLIEEVNDEDK